MRIPKKRELIAYLALCLENRSGMNVGEALDILRMKLGFSNKTALSILRRLSKQNLVLKTGLQEYKCLDPLEYFKRLVEDYSSRRKRGGYDGTR
ncbi:hypothetical protein ACSU1N_03025 [Thermogladius sp. 4427co]|uniref:hypothetical protein n=1 Tax=Thermogladius sp. 4427co TaxID=3450718 RepID=UPI003F78FAFF